LDFTVLCGPTYYCRKGTSWRAIRNLLYTVAPHWAGTRIRDGFQSGEAIIHCCRDDQAVVTDKRLLIAEEEFVELIRVANRKDCKLFQVFCKMWDAPPAMSTTGKLSDETATGLAGSVIGHITKELLTELMPKTEIRGGFINRFLWCVTQGKPLRMSGAKRIDWTNHGSILADFDAIFQLFDTPQLMDWDTKAFEVWKNFYESMEIPKSTLMADIVARGPDHVLRLSMIYACLDASLKIQPDHIKAALKVWDYCKRSAAWIFGQYLGNRQADLLRWTLQRTPEGMTREQIIDEVFNRHIAGAKLDRVLSELVDAELITMAMEPTKGKPRQRWKSVQP
jgi:Protein of unknown function (DUF3987)